MLHQLLDGIKFRGPRFFTAYQGIQGSDLSSVLFHFSGAWQAPPQRHWDWEGWADHSTFAGRKCFLLLPSVRLDTGGGRRCLAAAYSRQDTQPALRANLSRPNRDETWIWGCCERSWLEEEQEKLGFLRLEEAFWLRVPWHQGLDGWHSSESDQCFKIKVVCVCLLQFKHHCLECFCLLYNLGCDFSWGNQTRSRMLPKQISSFYEIYFQ